MTALERIKERCEKVCYGGSDRITIPIEEDFLIAYLSGEIEKDTPIYNKLKDDFWEIKKAFAKLRNDIVDIDK